MLGDNVQVLVVDDDAGIRDLLAEYLSRHGCGVKTAADGVAMTSILSNELVDILVLDVMLPGDDGLTLCRNLRADPKFAALPIMMLTARGDDFDKIIGLEMGADDYLPKPFNPRELLARIKSLLRRSQHLNHQIAEDHRHLLHFDRWVLDLDTRELVGDDGEKMPLSSGEFRLLRLLLERAGRVLNRDQIMDALHGRDSEPFDRSIDVQISRLRQKLGDDARESRLIQTVRGEGYRLCCEVRKSS